MYQVLILLKDKNITIEDETDRIRNKTVVAEHSAAINAISEW